LEHATLTCPFCGAPHRDVIPSGTVQVKCKYCGGTILVPAQLGGAVWRCPNHPNVLAVGLCNDCSGSFCDGCLYLHEVKGGTLHLCPNCFRNRKEVEAAVLLIISVVDLLFGVLLILVPGLATFMGGVILLAFGFLAIAWSVRRFSHFPKGVTLKDKREALKREEESRKALGSEASVHELYNVILRESQQSYGSQLGTTLLERKIDSYVHAGMTRSEAIRRVAEEKGY